MASRSISFWHASYRGEKAIINSNSRPPGGSASGPESTMASRSISFWHPSYRGEKAIINKKNSRPPDGSNSGPRRRCSPSLCLGPSASGTPPIGEKRQLVIQILGHQVDQLLVLSPPWRPDPSASGIPPIGEKRQLLIQILGR